jgi:hypothetical protein
MRRLPVLLLLAACKPEAEPDTGTEPCRRSVHLDADGDGHAAPEATIVEDCQAEDDGPGLDCDDGDASIHPDAEDAACDGIDSDCDGTVEEPQDYAWYVDEDGDGYGAGERAEETACEDPRPENAADNAGDCDDEDPTRSPGAVEESCIDGFDANCDGEDDCAIEGDVSLAGTALSHDFGTGAGAAMLALDRRDILVGAPGDGTVSVVSASDDGPEARAVSGISGGSAGTSLARTGIDDGSSEVYLVGAPDAGGGAGAAYAVYNDGVGTIAGEVAALPIGEAVGGGDGLVGVSYNQGTSWTIYLLTGEDLPAAGESVTASGDSLSYIYGFSPSDLPPALATLAGSDDLPALAVGVAGYSTSGTSDSIGAVYLFEFGDALTGAYRVYGATASREGSSAGALLGTSLAVFDLTGDGADDLLVGAPGADAVYLFAAESGMPNVEAEPTATFHGVGAGAWIAPGGDTNGDDIAEVLIAGSSATWLVSADQIDATDSAALATFDTALSSGASADLDLDGNDDLLLGDTTSGNLYFLPGGPAAP